MAVVDIEKLADLAAAAGSRAPATEVLQLLAASARQLVDADRAVIDCVVDDIDHVASEGDAISAAETQHLDVLCATIRRERRPSRMNQSQLRAAGVEKTSSWLGVPICSRDGQLLGVLQLHDQRQGPFDADDEYLLAQVVAPLVALAVDAACLRARLERTKRSCEELVGGLGHDLNDSLQSIRSCAALLGRPLPEEKQTYARAAIDRGVKQLVQRIVDWSDMTLLDSNLSQIQPATSDARLVLDEVSGDNPSRVDWQIDDDGALVQADPKWLGLLFRKLLAFAAEHAPDQRISVSARRVDGQVQFSVSGLGPALKGTFARTDLPRRRGRQVQLSIVKSIVTAHRSQTWIDSNDSNGTLCFTLPASL